MTSAGALPIGGSYSIIDNDGADAVVGTYAGLPEGAQFTMFANTFQITYVGSSGNDVLTARPARVEFDRAAGWSDTVATGFERVYAYASGGGLDRAYLYDSSGNDTLFGRGDYGYLTDSRGSYYLYFKYFDEVFAHSEDDDKSTRDIVNVNPSLLYLLELEGTW